MRTGGERMSPLTEHWAPVREAPGYFVSDLGRLRGPRGAMHPTAKRRPGKPPYFGATLCVGKKRLTRNVHRLVLEAFVGARPPGLSCRHLNGNSLDNRLKNLEWGTYQKNNLDRSDHGTMPKGERHGGAVLTERLVLALRMRVSLGASMMRAASDLGVAYGTAVDAIKRKTWRHVP